MLGFLGLGKIKIAIIAVLATGALTVMGLLYWQNSSLREDNTALVSRAAGLETAVEIQKQTIADAVTAINAWKDQMAGFQQQLTDMAEVQEAASAETRRLNDVFAKHDLERLSLARPGLIENRINAGTADVLRMFEDATRLGRAGEHRPD